MNSDRSAEKAPALPDDDLFLSVVAPCHNEEGNVQPLAAAIAAALEPLAVSFEILFVDDCSTDGTWTVLKNIVAATPRARALRLAQNQGQSAALWAGMRAARGQLIATLDADLQNDPADLPKFLAAINGADCVTGSRVASRARGDSKLKVLSSRIANAVRNTVLGEHVSDAGCSYRLFKKQCLSDIVFFKGAHRFLPTLMRMAGYHVVEVEVSHHPRASGQSHYGIRNRLFKATTDMFAMRWLGSRLIRCQIAESLPATNPDCNSEQTKPIGQDTQVSGE